MWRNDRRGNIWKGAVLGFLVLSIVAASVALIIAASTRIAWWLGAAVAMLVSWTTLAARGLDGAAFAVEGF